MRRTGPLGALPRLSSAARRALAGCAVLAALGGAALVGQAWALATVLANVVAGAPPGGPLGVLAAAVVARAFLGWATQVVAARAAAGAKEELRARLLDRALALGPEWIAATGPAKLTTLATKGLDALDNYFTVYLPALVQAAVLPLGIGGVILLADWQSAVVVAVTLPLVRLFAALVGLRTRDRVTEAAATERRLAAHLFELVRALPVLTAFGRAAAQADAVHRLSEAQRKTTMATLRIAFASALVLELIATLSVALVAVVVGLRLITGDVGLAVGLFVLILAPECYLPLRAAGATHHASEAGMEAVRRMAELPAPPSPRPATRPTGPLRVTNLKVRRRDGFAPDGLSFVARPGEIVHLDSPSGSGKSTTFAALLGFVTPAAGTIRLGSTTLGETDSEAWRRHLAWVPQSPKFTGGTVRAELTLAVSDFLESAGNPAADPARDPETAGQPQAKSYPQPPSYPQARSTSPNPSPPTGRLARRDAPGIGWGLGTVRARGKSAGQRGAGVAQRVGIAHLLDRGVDGLSLGERQRVAVARALLRVEYGATVLLLDEPTAHLDPIAAGHVMAAVRDAADAGVVVVLATHRAVPPAEATPAARQLSTASGDHELARRPLRELLSRRLLTGAALGAAGLLAGVALTATSAWLIAKASTQPPILTLSVAIVGVRAFGLARAGLRYAERLVTHDAALRTAGALRVRLWRALTRLLPAHRVDFAELTTDIDTVRDLTPRVLLPPLVAAFVCVAAAATQLAILPAAGLALVIAVAAAGLGAPAVALAVERRATRALAAGRRRVAAGVLTLLDAAPDLIACGAHRTHRIALAELDAELAGRARRQAFGAGAATALITLATGAAAVASIWLAAGPVDPLLVPVLALIPLALAEPLALLPPAAPHLEPLRAAHTELPAGTHQRPPAGGISLRDVDVRWPGAAEPALRGVTLDVPRGSHVAVVGPSGAGKSTLLAFLLGFLPAERGTATVPARAGWCPQQPHLAATTLRENLRVADPAASPQRMRKALRQAEIEGWADRLDTDPTTASGGEAQRLALARALLADADVLLLDEPTAHLDVPTAKRVLRNLRATGRTIVHVTHRAGETAGADVILEVDAGRVRVSALA